jgi:hypothetical protein
VHHFVNQFVADLEQSQTKAEKKRVLPTETAKQWIAPPQGVTKVDIDATVVECGLVYLLKVLVSL